VWLASWLTSITLLKMFIRWSPSSDH
jgi:hypothetical protein